MSDEQWKARGGEAGDTHHHHHQQQQQHPYEPHQVGPQYGTFPGVTSHQTPAMGFPQPVPPTGVTGQPSFPGPTYYPHGYEAVHGMPFYMENLKRTFTWSNQLDFIKLNQGDTPSIGRA